MISEFLKCGQLEADLKSIIEQNEKIDDITLTECKLIQSGNRTIAVFDLKINGKSQENIVDAVNEALKTADPNSYVSLKSRSANSYSQKIIIATSTNIATTTSTTNVNSTTHKTTTRTTTRTTTATRTTTSTTPTTTTRNTTSTTPTTTTRTTTRTTTATSSTTSTTLTKTTSTTTRTTTAISTTTSTTPTTASQAVLISTSVWMEVMLVMCLRPVPILTEATIATVNMDSRITKIPMEMEKYIGGTNYA